MLTRLISPQPAKNSRRPASSALHGRLPTKTVPLAAAPAAAAPPLMSMRCFLAAGAWAWRGRLDWVVAGVRGVGDVMV